MKKIFLIVLFAFVVGCGTTVEPQTEIVIDHVATQVAATMQAINNATPIPTSTELPTESPSIGIRSNPVPLGQPFGLVYQNTANFQVTVLEVIRGQNAWNIIYQANMFNEPAKEGMEYAIAKIGVNYQTSSQEDLTLNITDWEFKSVSNNQIFSTSSIVPPEPALNVNLFPGGYGEGYIVLDIFAADPVPLIIYNELLSTDMFYFSMN